MNQQSAARAMTPGIEHVAVIGAGMIGASVALLFTGHGYQTTVLVRGDEQAQRARDLHRSYLADLERAGLVSRKQAEACARRLHFTQSYGDLADIDFATEAVVEDLAAKEAVYRQLEDHCPQLRVVVSTTSALAADVLAGLCGPRLATRLAVAHPFNPAHLVPFVECLPAARMAPEALTTVKDVLASLGRKVAIMRKAAPGFIANRLQHALVREAIHIVEEGITDADGVDTALTYSFAPRYTSVGLLRHQDYAGLDMVQAIQRTILPTLCNDDTSQRSVDKAVARGNLGAKTGQGLHDWRDVDLDEYRQAGASPYYRFFDWPLPD